MGYLTSVTVIKFVLVTIGEVVRIGLLNQEPTQQLVALAIGIAYFDFLDEVRERVITKYWEKPITSYVIPSHTPASSSSNDFQVNLGYGSA